MSLEIQHKIPFFIPFSGGQYAPNSPQINAVESRSTKGVQVMKPKDGSVLIKVTRLENTKLTDPEYYRKSESLNAIGFYLKPGDEI
jgi:DNA gyrase subunit A